MLSITDSILIWIIELNRVDEIIKISVMAPMAEQPREGNLKKISHMFDFLQCNTQMCDVI